MREGGSKRTVGIVLYPGFEVLDVFGPVEMFANVPDGVTVVMVAERAGPVKSAQGPSAVADHGFADCPALDLVLVPGGIGSREEVKNEALLSWLRAVSENAEAVTAVCTGSAILAKAGLLDGRRATSNKRAFSWVMEQGPRVEWITEARWVDDGNRVTSAGVTAGMDMSLALIERMFGPDVAQRIADGTEYERHTDSSWDPFAKLNGL